MGGKGEELQSLNEEVEEEVGDDAPLHPPHVGREGAEEEITGGGDQHSDTAQQQLHIAIRHILHITTTTQRLTTPPHHITSRHAHDTRQSHTQNSTGEILVIPPSTPSLACEVPLWPVFDALTVAACSSRTCLMTAGSPRLTLRGGAGVVGGVEAGTAREAPSASALDVEEEVVEVGEATEVLIVAAGLTIVDALEGIVRRIT